jgi:hypothetical protein
VENLVPRQEIMLAYLPIWLAYFWPRCPTQQPLQKTFNSYYMRQHRTVWSPSQVSISSSIQWCHLANIYGSKYMVLQVHKLASKILWRQNKDVYNSVSNYLIMQYHWTQDTYSNIIVARFSTQIQASRITSSGHAMGPRILGGSRSSSLLLCWMRSELFHTIICHLRQMC